MSWLQAVHALGMVGGQRGIVPRAQTLWWYATWVLTAGAGRLVCGDQAQRVVAPVTIVVSPATEFQIELPVRVRVCVV